VAGAPRSLPVDPGADARALLLAAVVVVTLPARAVGFGGATELAGGLNFLVHYLFENGAGGRPREEHIHRYIGFKIAGETSA
jgi:hypothetical protein